MKNVLRFGILTVLVGILSLVPSASGQTALPAGTSTDGVPGAAQGINETTQPEEIVEATQLPATPWGTPVLVSPKNATALFHYPRTTTLAWQPVTSAISYLVERAFLSGTTWNPYPQVTVSGNGNASYTFDFVGDQKGRWRVTAFNGTIYSTPSAWWTFSYNTKPQMATPTLTNPANNQVFGHYPRNLTLSWKMAPAAAGYKLEIAFCQPDRVTCANYPLVTITDPLKSDYTFEFVGAQPGKWRVTTLGGSLYRDSAASGWRWFSFTQ
ncbi:MAG: hypothetical protein LAO56_08520 [Acidobacteriia bacterium]|nr:hypothetical protein [Terriglobia bacterium]